MKWLDASECPACLIYSRVSGLRRAGAKTNDYISLLSMLTEMLRKGRTEAFVESFEFIKRLKGFNPYQEEKKTLNTLVLEKLEKLAKVFEKASLLRCLEFMASANAVDVEMLDYKYGGNFVEAIVATEPVYRHITKEHLEKLVSESKRLALVVDNAGEIVVDLLAAKRIVEQDVKVTIFARSSDYEIDVTVDEVKELAKKLNVENIEFVGSGNAYPPLNPRSPARSTLENYDLVIIKGIANFEQFLEAPLKAPTIALLRAKCKPLARLFDVKIGIPVITYANKCLTLIQSRES